MMDGPTLCLSRCLLLAYAELMHTEVKGIWRSLGNCCSYHLVRRVRTSGKDLVSSLGESPPVRVRTRPKVSLLTASTPGGLTFRRPVFSVKTQLRSQERMQSSVIACRSSVGSVAASCNMLPARQTERFLLSRIHPARREDRRSWGAAGAIGKRIEARLPRCLVLRGCQKETPMVRSNFLGRPGEISEGKAV